MVGILTFHKAINYGAVLQAYALKTAVESFGEQCSVINYTNRKMLKESKVFYTFPNSSIKDKVVHAFCFPMRCKLVKEFNKFQSKYLNLSGKIITEKEQLKELSKKIDKIITGSDQVFNYKGTGEDFNFYLEFENDKNKKVAYAPSFGLTQIEDCYKDKITNCLNDFYALSVRESVGQDIVEKLTGIRPQKVCDPTFLMEKQSWVDMCKDVKIKRPYVLVYSFGSKHLDGIAQELAKDFNGIVINVNRAIPSFNNKIKTAYAPSPKEFLGLIKNAKAVVTNSFHGIALSILLEKEFYGFKNNYTNSNATNNRFKFFSDDLGLSNRIFDSPIVAKCEPIDYAIVSKKIEKIRLESLNYLKSSINGF